MTASISNTWWEVVLSAPWGAQVLVKKSTRREAEDWRDANRHLYTRRIYIRSNTNA